MHNKGLIAVILIVTAITITIILTYMSKNKEIEYDFKIYFFNAGKADAILLSKNNKYILIDTGEESLSDEILEYFKKNNITRLEYLIITHFDKDHIGSASTIIDNIEIGEVLESNSPKDSIYYANYLNSLSNKSITPKIVSGDYELLFEDLNIIVNGPESIYENSESNNSSLIVKITYNDNKFLFMGDSENARIKDYLKDNTDSYNLIKIPYHGFYLKQLDNLLDIVNPQYGVMTCSKEKGCENDTIELLKKYNIKYYMTKNGSITILSNGKNIKIIN